MPAGNGRTLEPASQTHMTPAQPSAALPPLLRKLVADYAATGRPPAYLPKPSSESES